MWRCPSCGHPASFADPRHPWPIDWTCDACGFAPARRDAIACLAPGLIDTLTGFDPDLFNILDRYEETSFWFVNRAALKTQSARVGHWVDRFREVTQAA